MIDYLLCFPDKDVAVEFGQATGYTFIDPESEEADTPTSAHGYVLTIIGECFLETGEMVDLGEPFGEVPEKEKDGKHWVLFRDITGNIKVPDEAEEFIVWASNRTERLRRRDDEGKYLSDDPDTKNDEAWETIPLRKPDNAPDRKFAGD